MIDGNTSLIMDEYHYKETYQRLCPSSALKKKSTKEFAFPTMWELFVWGAILGYIKKSPKPIKKKVKSPPFRWMNIDETHQKLLMIMIV